MRCGRYEKRASEKERRGRVYNAREDGPDDVGAAGSDPHEMGNRWVRSRIDVEEGGQTGGLFRTWHKSHTFAHLVSKSRDSRLVHRLRMRGEASGRTSAGNRAGGAVFRHKHVIRKARVYFGSSAIA